MDAAFAPRPDASALVVLVTNGAEARWFGEGRAASPRAFDARRSKTSKGRRSKTSRRTTSIRIHASMTMLSPESDAAKVPAAIDSVSSVGVRRAFDERRPGNGVRLQRRQRVSGRTRRDARSEGAARRTAFGGRRARARDDACFFLIAGERVYLLVSRGERRQRLRRLQRFPTQTSRCPRVGPGSRSRRPTRREPGVRLRPRCGACSSPAARRVSAPIVIDATDGWTRFGAFDEQSTRAPIEGRPTGVHEVTAILPAPLSNAPRGVVVFGRDGSAATVWTGARDVARRDARAHADATGVFLGSTRATTRTSRCERRPSRP